MLKVPNLPALHNVFFFLIPPSLGPHNPTPTTSSDTTATIALHYGWESRKSLSICLAID